MNAQDTDFPGYPTNIKATYRISGYYKKQVSFRENTSLHFLRPHISFPAKKQLWTTLF